MATNVNKVLEEIILKSKQEFHEMIINIIKRKRQVLGDVVQPHSQGEGEVLKSLGIQGIRELHMPYEHEDEGVGSMVDCNQFSRKVKQIHFEDDQEYEVFHRSHYSRSH